MRALGGGNEGYEKSVTFAYFLKIQKNMICLLINAYVYDSKDTLTFCVLIKKTIPDLSPLLCY